jgi:preprotein translocase subunit SecD
VEVDGANLTDARAGQDNRTGEWVVNFTFDSVGTSRFANDDPAECPAAPSRSASTEAVITAPRSASRSPAEGARSAAASTARSANDLAVLLRAGALPAPADGGGGADRGPSWGADAIRRGVISLAVGAAFVFLYMGLAYGLFGWFANIALLVNIMLMLAASLGAGGDARPCRASPASC